MREVALRLTPPEKICRSQRTNQSCELNQRLPDFVLCDLQIFSDGVYPPSATTRIVSFLFPIVFDIILIHFFDGKNDGAAEHPMACSVLQSLFAPFERGRTRSPTFTECNFWQWKV